MMMKWVRTAGISVLLGVAVVPSGWAAAPAAPTNVRIDAGNESGPGIWWISTAGSDSNDGRTRATAFRTFHRAFQSMGGGDTLYVDDGTYFDSVGGFGGKWTTDIPSGSSGKPTRIRGFNPHAVVVDGQGRRLPLYIYKTQYVEVSDMVFVNSNDNPVTVEQSSYVTLRRVGAANAPANCDNCVVVGVYESDHVLVEDVWTWGLGRYGVLLWHGNNNIARRTVTRYDGSGANSTTNPKAGAVLYSEDNSIAENNVTLDHNASAAGVRSAFFTTSTSFPLGSVKWLGNIAINMPNFVNGGIHIDSLNSVGTVTLINNVVANLTGGPLGGIFAENGNGQLVARHNTIYNVNSAGIRTEGGWSATVSDNLVVRASSECLRAAGSLSGSSNHMWSCSGGLPGVGLLNADPLLKYLLRIEPGAPGKGTASDGGDRGATIVYRYLNGTLTNLPLWPWPNEAFIKQDMCTRAGVTRGWCGTNKTLTQYIWEALGNPSPY